MDSITSVIMPEAMISSIEDLSKSKNCSRNTIIKLAIAKFLFDQTLPAPEVYRNIHDQIMPLKTSNDTTKEIPLDKVVSVQYTLDDGRIIHIIRQSKIR